LASDKPGLEGVATVLKVETNTGLKKLDEAHANAQNANMT
jgi:hypothetical protein